MLSIPGAFSSFRCPMDFLTLALGSDVSISSVSGPVVLSPFHLLDY